MYFVYVFVYVLALALPNNFINFARESFKV